MKGKVGRRISWRRSMRVRLTSHGERVRVGRVKRRMKEVKRKEKGQSMRGLWMKVKGKRVMMVRRRNPVWREGLRSGKWASMGGLGVMHVPLERNVLLREGDMGRAPS
jgi:hypothetical protein